MCIDFDLARSVPVRGVAQLAPGDLADVRLKNFAGMREEGGTEAARRGTKLIVGAYLGLTQWQPAIHSPPHLAAIAPQILLKCFKTRRFDARLPRWTSPSFRRACRPARPPTSGGSSPGCA